MRQTLGYALAIVAGLLAGFFIVFNSVFSDVSGTDERVFSFALILVVYAVLGLIVGYLAASWLVGIVLAAPAVLLVAWYAVLREPDNLALHLLYIAVTLAAACLAAYAGGRVAVRTQTSTTPEG